MSYKKTIALVTAGIAILGGAGIAASQFEHSANTVVKADSKGAPTADSVISTLNESFNKAKAKGEAANKGNSFALDTFENQANLQQYSLAQTIANIKAYFTAKASITNRDSKVTKMNLNQIKAGDFSSLQGTYRNYIMSTGIASSNLNPSDPKSDGKLQATQVDVIIGSKLFSFAGASAADPNQKGLIEDGKSLSNIQIYDLKYDGEANGTLIVKEIPVNNSDNWKAAYKKYTGLEPDPNMFQSNTQNSQSLQLYPVGTKNDKVDCFIQAFDYTAQNGQAQKSQQGLFGRDSN